MRISDWSSDVCSSDLKYDRVLEPMAPLVLVGDEARLVAKKYMQLETLFHELSHSLGPGTITVDGRQTTVNDELKEQASAIEEGKADVSGAYHILFMMAKRAEESRWGNEWGRTCRT